MCIVCQFEKATWKKCLYVMLKLQSEFFLNVTDIRYNWLSCFCSADFERFEPECR